MAIQNISVDLGTMTIAQLVDFICLEFNYQPIQFALGIGEPNPETKNQFAKRMLVEWYMGIVNRQRKKAEEAIANANFIKTIFT